jgi:hypothetical protein
MRLKSNDLKSSKQLKEDKYDALVFHSFDFERTLWRLFQKCVVYTKLDIYLFLQDKLNVPSPKNFWVTGTIWTQQNNKNRNTNHIQTEKNRKIRKMTMN